MKEQYIKAQFIIAGNWKMNKTVQESIDFLENLHENLHALPSNDTVKTLIFPPFTSLYPLAGKSNLIKTGAQNLHFEEKGAFTGEISPLMLENLVDYVLIGHSERREIFNETDEDINKKIKTALNHNFTPVLCIGETLAEREANKTNTKLQQQLDKNLENLSPQQIQQLVIAYEPIWAIGTGKNATPAQAQEAHRFIRKILKKKINSKETAESMKILYGGSVKPSNSQDILSQNDINGVLIGGASLKSDDFFAIIRDAYKLTA